MDSCALTDHGWMAGIIPFYKACKKDGIKPIIGVEAYITADPDGMTEGKTRDNMHMILLAKDNIGYEKLLEVMSNAAMDNFYYKPRVFKDNLRQLAGHVVATTACLGGIFAKKAVFELDEIGNAKHCHDPEGTLERELKFYLDVFGSDFYLELQGWNSSDNRQLSFNKFLIEFGEKHILPFVITADAHYLREEDYQLHEMLMALQMKKSIEEYRASSEDMMYGPYYYVAGPDEMLRRATALGKPDAFYNTGRIADQCNVEIELGKYQEIPFNIQNELDYKEFCIWKQQFKT